MRVEVDLKGIDEAIKRIGKFEHTKRQRVKDAVNEAALNVQKGAKKRAPVDTGRLRSSIAIQPYNEGLTMQIGTKLHYAPYVEWGTGKFAAHPKYGGRQTPWIYPESKKGRKTGEMVLTHGSKPQPFLFPAWDEERPAFIKAMRRALSDD